MKYEELAFVNQQLAGMLRSGIPLEGALRRLCEDMRRGRLRTELEALEADLAGGAPLSEALDRRALPDFYRRMIQLGARTGDLPGVLILVADYYQRAHLGWTRLKGLMVYPLIVLLGSLALSAFVAVIFGSLFSGDSNLLGAMTEGRSSTAEAKRILLIMWAPAAGLFLVALAAGAALAIPRCRRYLRWWLPGFRENSLTNFASTMDLMLSSGSHLGEALELAGHLESGTPAGTEVQRWRSRLAQGNAKIAEIAEGSRVFPPLFVWLLAQGGEDLAAGFRKAAEIYFGRATYRSELLLHVALPVSVLVLGLMIVGQFLPLVQALTFTMDMLGSMDGLGP
jgi:type II secretory pathway component PulF